MSNSFEWSVAEIKSLHAYVTKDHDVARMYTHEEWEFMRNRFIALGLVEIVYRADPCEGIVKLGWGLSAKGHRVISNLDGTP